MVHCFPVIIVWGSVQLSMPGCLAGLPTALSWGHKRKIEHSRQRQGSHHPWLVDFSLSNSETKRFHHYDVTRKLFLKSWLINSPLGPPGLFLFFLLLLLAAWPSGDKKKKSRDEAKIGKKADDKRSPNRLKGGGEFTASRDQNPRGTRMNRNTKLGERSEAGNPRAQFWLWPPQGQPGQKTKRRGLCGYRAAASLHQTD